MARGHRRDHESEMIIALTFAANFVIKRYVPAHMRANAHDSFMAIALGIVGGTCGPNGDFTSSYRPEVKNERGND